jgi:DNA helicase MCM9
MQEKMIEPVVFRCSSGTVLRRWRPLSAAVRSDIEMVLAANHLEVCNDQRTNVLITQDVREAFAAYWRDNAHRPLHARNHILASMCPQVSVVVHRKIYDYSRTPIIRINWVWDRFG